MLRHGQGGEEAGKGKEDFFVSLHFNGGGGEEEERQENFFFFWLSIQKDLISASLI